ncbi:inorganic phosphate transporter [Sodaliphilus sp.]|uniref:inorganic phosphate transporter n=1 Tax=Sodaliphilus sp. TaxID=2815818 RepID=UPI00388E615C
MNTIFIIIVAFLMLLAIFDLVVGVSNDAVNFLNSAIGAKVAKFRTIVLIAAIGVFAGAAMSNGMMDVARHGIMTPEYFSFFDVMCVFLAVMVTDVVLLDVFNTLGMPTSTTVSMVFELLGGAFAIALLKIIHGTTMADGTLLSLGDLLNTEKAISVIMGIFLSVAIAFVLGSVVQWIARMVFTFTYRVNGKSTSINNNTGGLTSSSLKIGIFGGIAVTSIIWFLLINGLKGSNFMTPEVKEIINAYTWYIIGGCMLVFSVIMTIASAFKLPVLKFVVLLGTFALAMAFAGNDLVNFIGVPLTGLEAYQDYAANGSGTPDGYMMTSLMESAHTPSIFLVAAGVVMVLSLVYSKKAQNVVKTSVDLSRQDEGDEMFGSSAVARTIVRTSSRMAGGIVKYVPASVGKWIDSRFNSDTMILPEGAAFDQIRAAVNLVLAGLLVALGTSMKLPLSTTYVTFMVAMGTSLADRAWTRESAVFRITGVLSVIGGWFITAGAAFIACYLVTNALHFGSYIAMLCAIALAIFLLIRSNKKFKESVTEEDTLFKQMMRTREKSQVWQLLCEHIRKGNASRLEFVIENYRSATDSFINEEYRTLKRGSGLIDDERKELKRQRRREIIVMRRLDPLTIIQRNTWYFLGINSCQQMLYCMKRINDPLREHIGNNFSPIPVAYHAHFIDTRDRVIGLFISTLSMLQSGDFTDAEKLRDDCMLVQEQISKDRKDMLDTLQDDNQNINTLLLTVHILQESQELLSSLRHMIRGMNKFAGEDD